MKVRLYAGCLKLVEKSGVGQAVHHQKAMLERAGIETTYQNDRDAVLIHINTVFPDSLCASVLAKLRRQKVLCYGHSTMEDFKRSFKGSTALAPLFKLWIKLCYSRGDAIITPTEYSKKLLLSYGIQKPIYALSNGIDTAAFCPSAIRRQRFREKYGLLEDEKAVLSVGHYIERKGILDFIDLARANPQYRFFWFGSTNLRLVPERVGRAVKTAPEHLCFPGYVSSRELCDAYCGCDLFAFMSDEETEGIVVLEALSCEIPTIVRDIPVYDGWLVDGENVRKARSTADFQRLMDEILSGAAPDLRAAGRKAALERDLSQVGSALAAIYEQLLPPAHDAGSAQK